MMRPADHNDADIVLRLYELRREPVMRQARAFFMELAPRRYEDLRTVMDFAHPKNAFFRQVTSYWEMAASFVNRKVLHADLYADNCGEGLFVFAKLEPFLKEIRDTYSPTFLTQTERAIAENPVIAQRMNVIREVLKKRS
ncbi:MAG: hypothetical protein U1E76_26490 [Planctomycetota bacterium]